jgi:hypothetical protein
MELVKLTNGERTIEVPKTAALYLLNNGWTKVK